MNYEQEPVEGDYGMITFEDRYAPTYEEAAEKFWADIQADALECSVSCCKSLFGYHTGNCPLVREEDVKAQRADQSRIDYVRGK